MKDPHGLSGKGELIVSCPHMDIVSDPFPGQKDLEPVGAEEGADRQGLEPPGAQEERGWEGVEGRELLTSWPGLWANVALNCDFTKELALLSQALPMTVSEAEWPCLRVPFRPLMSLAVPRLCGVLSRNGWESLGLSGLHLPCVSISPCVGGTRADTLAIHLVPHCQRASLQQTALWTPGWGWPWANFPWKLFLYGQLFSSPPRGEQWCGRGRRSWEVWH